MQMSRLNIRRHTDTMVFHCALTLAAHLWHLSKRKGRGGWYITREDAARVRWTVGSAKARDTLWWLGFYPDPDGSWHLDGPTPRRMTISFRVWEILRGVAQRFNVPA